MSFDQSVKWMIFLFQILFLCVLLGLVPMGNGVLAYNVHIGNCFIFSLAFWKMMKCGDHFRHLLSVGGEEILIFQVTLKLIAGRKAASVLCPVRARIKHVCI